MSSNNAFWLGLCLALNLALAGALFALPKQSCETANILSYEKGWACAKDQSTCEEMQK